VFSLENHISLRYIKAAAEAPHWHPFFRLIPAVSFHLAFLGGTTAASKQKPIVILADRFDLNGKMKSFTEIPFWGLLFVRVTAFGLLDIRDQTCSGKSSAPLFSTYAESRKLKSYA
jgi:hypothetical protein